jgi:hypothetical protein
MKLLIEEKNPGYRLFLLFDIPLRKTNQVIRCLIPTSLVVKYNLKDVHNVCIQFKKFRRIFVSHKGKYNSFWKEAHIIIEDFEITNPSKLRLISAKESNEALKVRAEVLFGELDVETPANVKLSILNTLFLAPKIKSRSGIETKSLIDNSVGNRFLMTLDNYNQVIASLIPPEISNCHYPNYRGDIVAHRIEHIDEKLNIFIRYPNLKCYFNSICTPNQKEEINVNLRNMSNNEIGINHQTKFKNYSTKKELIDKFMLTEFFYKQDYLPKYSKSGMNKSLKILKDNRKLLYDDYVSRIYNQLLPTNLSVTEIYKINNLSQGYCEEIGYKIKQGNDSYFNGVVRSIRENLHRVKSTINRNSFKTDAGLENVYLESLQLNFDEIRESKDYTQLADKKVNMEKIIRIRNNALRAAIIDAVKIRGGNVTEGVVLKEAKDLGYDEKEILKEVFNLQEMGIVYKLNNIIYLDATEI